jgi:hypothetical protein
MAVINDYYIRHALLNCNKAVNVCTIANEEKQKNYKDLIIDIPFAEWINHSRV